MYNRDVTDPQRTLPRADSFDPNCQTLTQHPPGVTRALVPLTLDLDCFSIFAPRDIIVPEHDLITGAVRIVPAVIITAPSIS